MGQADSGKRVLVVEDDAMIRLLVEDMLDDLGFVLAGQAGRVSDAMALLDATAFDLAILDINLNGETSDPVADALAERGTPFVFATGYGALGLPDRFRDRPLIKKPFQIDGLRRALTAALHGAG